LAALKNTAKKHSVVSVSIFENYNKYNLKIAQKFLKSERFFLLHHFLPSNNYGAIMEPF
jgi:hypothetical protein